MGSYNIVLAASRPLTNAVKHDKSKLKQSKILIMSVLKTLFLPFILTIVSTSARCQNTFSLSQLIDMANCKTLSSFDTKARSNGYSWTNTENSTNEKGYHYQKVFIIGSNEFTNGLQFTDYGNGKPTISFTVSSDVKDNYFNSLKEQAKALGFTETANSPDSKNKILWFSYLNNTYSLGLGEKPQVTRECKINCVSF